jgi:chromosome segregation ATPase
MGQLKHLVESTNSKINLIQENIELKYMQLENRLGTSVRRVSLEESTNYYESECLDLMLESVLLEMDVAELQSMLGEEGEDIADVASRMQRWERDRSAGFKDREGLQNKIKMLHAKREEILQKIQQRKSELDQKEVELEDKFKQKLAMLQKMHDDRSEANRGLTSKLNPNAYRKSKEMGISKRGDDYYFKGDLGGKTTELRPADMDEWNT